MALQLLYGKLQVMYIMGLGDGCQRKMAARGVTSQWCPPISVKYSRRPANVYYDQLEADSDVYFK